jgi:spore germination protein YaaH
LFWLEDKDSVIKRLNLAKKYNLPGIASWRRGLETKDIWEIF